jgi:hypothetical protein
LVPPKAASSSDVPAGLEKAYDYTAAGYIRNTVGDALADYRNLKRSDPRAEPLIKRRTMTRAEYMLLLGLAEPGAEREHFQRAAAGPARRIKVEN